MEEITEQAYVLVTDRMAVTAAKRVLSLSCLIDSEIVKEIEYLNVLAKLTRWELALFQAVDIVDSEIEEPEDPAPPLG